MKVMKFGGTSVGSAQRIQHVANLINTPEKKIVVLSAMSGTTNALVQIGEALYAKNYPEAHRRIDELEAKYHQVVAELYTSPEAANKAKRLIYDHFGYMRVLAKNMFNTRKEKAMLAEGEILSTHLMFYYLEEIGVPVILLDALDFMRIDENEEPDLPFITEHLQAELHKYPEANLFLTQGYICLNSYGEVDNLKRGGSDYTASLIGAAIMAEEVQIWTDIDGMHNNDPRVVERTVPVAELSFDEAAELAYFGAKILHPQSVNPARMKKIPVRLLNTMQPEQPGTLITERSNGKGIKAVAAKDGITAIRVQSGRMLLAYGFLKKLFEVFERYKTPIDMVTTSEVAVSLTIDNPKHLQEIVKELQQFATVEVEPDQTIICVVGDMMEQKQDYVTQVLQAVRGIPIRMVSYGGSKNNVSLLIHSRYKADALKALNKGIFGL
ncbi:MAG: aspartate kinase [Cytophagales bacterium]|nr:aspartate kinase [Bernardetiaceae bacterium]MDW8209649.1 aspartate kinase [Cytophagales bacterium]